MFYQNVAPPRRTQIHKQQFTTRMTLLRSLNARVPLCIQAPEFLCHFQRTLVPLIITRDDKREHN